MIAKDILDEVIPVPELEDLRDKTVAELAQKGFVITNFHSGGVFYTLLMIVLRLKIELLELARTVLNQMFISHASGIWLDLKAADYSKKRKAAQKARGYVTVFRQDTGGETVKIAKGQVFKTEKDINGEELRFFSLEPAVLRKGAPSVDILVEAEQEGSRYNVPQGQITRTLTYIGDVRISNGGGWLVQEGSDTEEDESLRARCLRSWAELAIVPLKDTYINVCEAVPGVLYANVNDQHPRGQGTVDIIITSEAGAAGEELLEKCRSVCEEIREPDTDILVKSAEVIIQPIALTVTISRLSNQDGLPERIQSSIFSLLNLRGHRKLNELTHADIIHKVKTDIPEIRNVTVTTPPADVFLDPGKVILPGEITVTTTGV